MPDRTVRNGLACLSRPPWMSLVTDGDSASLLETGARISRRVTGLILGEGEGGSYLSLSTISPWSDNVENDVPRLPSRDRRPSRRCGSHWYSAYIHVGNYACTLARRTVRAPTRTRLNSNIDTRKTPGQRTRPSIRPRQGSHQTLGAVLSRRRHCRASAARTRSLDPMKFRPLSPSKAETIRSWNTSRGTP